MKLSKETLLKTGFKKSPKYTNEYNHPKLWFTIYEGNNRWFVDINNRMIFIETEQELNNLWVALFKLPLIKGLIG